MQLNYIEKTHESEIFRKDSITLNHNEMITRIDVWKHEDCLQKVKIYVGNKKGGQFMAKQNERTIEAG